MTQQNNEFEKWYIQRKPSGYLGNAPVWWAKGGAGYTSYVQNAEKFNFNEAQKLVVSGDKYAMFKCVDIDARLHLVFDMQDFGKLGTDAPCDFIGGSYAKADSESILKQQQNTIAELKNQIIEKDNRLQECEKLAQSVLLDIGVSHEQ